mmetsp:Transcript_12968/g.23606  ORF Transcript_12968/g.23606 Transcript_12968/m.23606 type:complete len:113 (+) Transcript_12968:223-561(+)
MNGTYGLNAQIDQCNPIPSAQNTKYIRAAGATAHMHSQGQGGVSLPVRVFRRLYGSGCAPTPQCFVNPVPPQHRSRPIVGRRAGGNHTPPTAPWVQSGMHGMRSCTGIPHAC